MIIGIVVALKRESEYLKSRLGAPIEENRLCGVDFNVYKVGENTAVIADCGAGVSEAASAAAILVANYKAELLLNYGYVGGLVKNLGVSDIITVKSVVQHDYDLTAFGEPLGKHDCLDSAYIEADPYYTEKLAKNLPSAVIACGNSFVSNQQDKTRIAEAFNASICDMESAGIALVAKRSGIPFAMVKLISDGVEGDSTAAFAANSHNISDCSDIIYDFLLGE